MSQTHHKALSSVLRDRRTARGWSQADVARAAGVTQGAISKLECDPRGSRLDTIIPVGAALGLSPNELAEYAGLWKAEDQHEEDFPDGLLESVSALLGLPEEDQQEITMTFKRLVRAAAAERRQYR